MRYPSSLLDEIRARLPASAVVGRRVKLMKAGREWKGLSPFNSERTPSFFVNDQKGRFFDFSSGKDGDIFNFLMETEGLSFPEAVERLAQEAGVALPRVSEEAVAQEKRRNSLHEVMELAACFFEDTLQGRAGAEARRYLSGRDLGIEVQRDFRLGHAPGDRFALRDHLAGRGVPIEAMIEAGLLIHGEEIAVPYDRFRDRVMFPITDARGRIIAFGGRALQKDAQAKYLNSPETVLFHKGANLYNQQRARKAAHDKGFVVAVEGYVDVIAMTRAGFSNTVAPLGTALTEEQLGLLWRMGSEPILCFDGDKAGQRAAFRAIDVALPHLEPGRSLRFAFLPAGQDPDDLLRSAGAPAIAAVVEAPQPMVDVLWRRELERGPLTTPEQRAEFEKRLRDLLSQIRDETLRRHYRAEIERRLQVFVEPPRRERREGQRFERRGARMAGMRSQEQAPVSLGSAPVTVSESLRRSALFGSAGAYPQREVALIVAAANQTRILHEHVELLAGLEFQSGDLARLASHMADFASLDDDPSPEALRLHIARMGTGGVLLRAEAALNACERWARAEAKFEEAEAAWLQAAGLHEKARTLHKEIIEVEAEFGRDGSESSFQRLRALRMRLTLLEEGGQADENFGPKSG